MESFFTLVFKTVRIIPMEAAKFIQNLSPDFIKASDDRLLAHIEKNRQLYKLAVEPLRKELAELGEQIETLADLRGRLDLSPLIVRCLLQALERTTYAPLIFDVLACLRVPSVRTELDRLIQFWKNHENPELRVCLLNIFEVSCKSADIPRLNQLLEGIKDKALERNACKTLKIIAKNK